MILSPMRSMVPGPSTPHLDHVHTSAALPLQPGVFPHMPPTKRPKLSLQTSQLPTSYASSASATGKSVDTLATTTPTTLNTFNNTFDLSLRPSPSSATASPGSFRFHQKAAASPLRRTLPYSLNFPLGVRSILKNSRIEKDYRRGSLTASASPRTGRRVFFPPAKKVSFQPIAEEIITHTYTARHVDISSEDEEISSTSDKDESPEQQEVTPSVPQEVEISDRNSTLTVEPPFRSPGLESRGRRRGQRSPSSLRVKRKRRRWEWTLGEIEGGHNFSSTEEEYESSEEAPSLPRLDSSSSLDAIGEHPIAEREQVQILKEGTDTRESQEQPPLADDVHDLASSTTLPLSPPPGSEQSRQRRVKGLIKMFEDAGGV